MRSSGTDCDNTVEILTKTFVIRLKLLNTYWTRPSPTSSLLHPDKVILGEAKLSPILFRTGAMNWMLDEVKSNKCFIIPKKSDQIS